MAVGRRTGDLCSCRAHGHRRDTQERLRRCGSASPSRSPGGSPSRDCTTCVRAAITSATNGRWGLGMTPGVPDLWVLEPSATLVSVITPRVLKLCLAAVFVLSPATRGAAKESLVRSGIRQRQYGGGFAFCTDAAEDVCGFGGRLGASVPCQRSSNHLPGFAGINSLRCERPCTSSSRCFPSFRWRKP